jgi:ribosomal subunit interface protein
MQVPVQITFRHLEPTPAIRAAVEARVEELEHFFDRIIGCRVIVETPHRRHRTGRIHHVRIDLTVPGEELVVGRDPADDGAHEDVYVAIRDAFDAADRQLEDYVRRLRGQVKERVGPPHGIVARVGADYGFLTDDDGRQIYFHRNSVLGDFDRLVPGDEVRFAEEAGDRGPQASTVTPVGKSGHASAPVGRDRI